MTTAPNDAQQTPPAPLSSNRHWSPDVVISVMTGPVLLGLLGARAIAEGLYQLGLASEELFRGERLPILHKYPVEAYRNDTSEAEPE